MPYALGEANNANFKQEQIKNILRLLTVEKQEH